MAGVDKRRSLPTFATPRLSKAAQTSTIERVRGRAGGVDVWVWADSFTEYFRTGPGRSAIEYLEGAGLEVRVIDERACCALTWTSTGQRDTARTILDRTRATLAPYSTASCPVLGIEPLHGGAASDAGQPS